MYAQKTSRYLRMKFRGAAAILLAVCCMVFNACGDPAGSDTVIDGPNNPDNQDKYGDFRFSGTTTLTITRYTGTEDDVTIPAEIYGKPVTVIGKSAFGYGKLTNVTIPDSVTNIASYAFMVNQLISITIGEDITLNDASFGGNFETVYNSAGKAAGTYTRVNTGSAWSKL